MQFEHSRLYNLKTVPLCRVIGTNSFSCKAIRFVPPNELPPLSRGAEYDRKHKHEEEDGNQRVETPDTCLCTNSTALAGSATVDARPRSDRAPLKKQVSDQTKKL